MAMHFSSNAEYVDEFNEKRFCLKSAIYYPLTKADTLKVGMHLLNANGVERCHCFCGL